MPGGRVPRDRTIKQPAEGFCRNPECAVDGQQYRFRVEHDHFACPKCGADTPPMVDVLVLTHFLHRHDRGPIRGKGGLRFVIACDDKRAYLATATNKEAATDNIDLVSCPGCLENAAKLGIFPSSDWSYSPEKKS